MLIMDLQCLLNSALFATLPFQIMQVNIIGFGGLGVSLIITFPFPKGLEVPTISRAFLFLERGDSLAVKCSPIVRFRRFSLSSSLDSSWGRRTITIW